MKKGIVSFLLTFLFLFPLANAHDDNYWIEVQSVYSSTHPYPPNALQKVRVYQPGAASVRVHFANLLTERNYDFVDIYDDYGNRVARYTGDYPAPFWTEPVNGDTLWVVLSSDGGVQHHGFDVDKYAWLPAALPPTPPFPPTPPVPPVPPVPPTPSYAQIAVDGSQNHDVENRTLSFYGRVLGFYPQAGMVRISAPTMPETVVGLNLAGNSFSTQVLQLPEGVLTQIEIVLTSTDGRQFSTVGYARAKNPGYRGFTETRQIR